MKKEINRTFVTKKKTFFSILTLVLLLFVAMVLPSCKDKGEESILKNIALGLLG